MSTLCIECAMKAYVEGRPASEALHDEEPDEHMKRVHPNGVTPEERQALQQQVLDKLHQQGMADRGGT